MDHQDHETHPISLRKLSDEAVVEIRNFIDRVLVQFDVHYAPEARRFYADRAAHNMLCPPSPATSDPPFRNSHARMCDAAKPKPSGVLVHR